LAAGLERVREVRITGIGTDVDDTIPVLILGDTRRVKP
jgi:hypothetical protein